MAKKAKVKVKGVVLLEAFLALLLMAMASYGLASVNSVQFSQMAAGRESDSAKNYAELEAEYLKSLGFDAVVTNNKDDDDPSRTPRYPDGEQSSVDKASNARDMTKFLGDTLGSEWRSTATLGKTINNINGDSDNKIQNIVVSVYKKSDGDNASPRATVTLPLSSQSSCGGGDCFPDITKTISGADLVALGYATNQETLHEVNSTNNATATTETYTTYVTLTKNLYGEGYKMYPKGSRVVIKVRTIMSIVWGNGHSDNTRNYSFYMLQGDK